MSNLPNNESSWNFHKQLQKSENSNITKRLDRYYLKRFAGKKIERVTNLRIQKSGIDLFVYDKNNDKISIEEKIRFKIFPDILLETISNDQTGALGWAVKPFQADWLCYYKQPKDLIILLPGNALRKAITNNINFWKAKFGERSAKNQGYLTWNVGVPEAVLFRAIDDEYNTIACPNCGTLIVWSAGRYDEKKEP